MTALSIKDVLCLNDLSAEQINLILDKAAEFKKQLAAGKKKFSSLKDKSIVTLFYENSTRTRVSFELAGKYLGGTVSNISASSSSVAKGESLIDTGKTLEQMGIDAIIIRHSVSGAAKLLSEALHISVINGGDGLHAHPTQALLDMLTIKLHHGGIKGKTVAIIGDIYHSRVARSNIVGLNKLGANVKLFGPATLVPTGIEDMGCKLCHSFEEALDGADAVISLRIQKERQQGGLFPTVGEYAQFYGMNMQRAKLAKPNAIFLHPGPINRNIEITGELADSPASVINEQVNNGLAVRMAIFELLLGDE